MNVIKYETPMSAIDFKLPTIFLAGCTVRGNQTHLKSWRPDAIEIFKIRNFEGNIIVPEFDIPTVSDKYRYDIPVWEFEGLRKSQVIMFWLPRTRELIGLTTNFELGYWIGSNRHKVIYGRPDDAYRITYCDIMWVEDGKLRYNGDYSIYNTLEKTVIAAMELLKNAKGK